MKNLTIYSSLCSVFLALIVGLFSVLATGCASYTANLTTTSGSPAASVDDASNIVNGMTVTAANVPAGESVKAIQGENVTLTLNAIQSSTASAKFSPTAATVAQQFATNSKAYAQTLGNMLQAGLKDVSAAAPTLAALTQEANLLASSWSTTPINPQEQATFTSVIATINKIGSNSTAISTFLTGLQTTGATSVSTSYEESIPGPGAIAQQVALENAIHPRPLMEGNLNNDY